MGKVRHIHQPKTLRALREDAPEREHQRAVAAFLDATVGPLGWQHTANERMFAGVKNRYSYAASLRAQGLKPGAPDILVFAEPVRGWSHEALVQMKIGGHPDRAPRGVAIELKAKGGELNNRQQEWAVRLVEHAWLWQLCVGADAAIDWLTELGF